MSDADLSMTARRFSVNDQDLYAEHMKKMARSCAGSFKAMEAAYRKCPFAMDGEGHLSDWIEVKEWEYVCECQEEELDLEYLVREKLFPDE